MNYKFTSLKQVLDLLEGGQELSAGNISERLQKSRTITHKYLKALVEQGKIEKIGMAPRVVYKIAKKSTVESINVPMLGVVNNYPIDYGERKIIDEVFFKFSPIGKKQIGLTGMRQWCSERNLDIRKKVKDYIKIYQYIESQFDACGMLISDDAFGKDFEVKHLDKVFYADQYKYMDFGRGKLAEMTFYGKTSQNKDLIFESLSEILPKLECLIAYENFDAIAITPWSIERKNQILGVLRKSLITFNLPFVNVIKYYEDGIAIPQKSLKTRQQRIQNARNTIFVDDQNAKNYKKVLLIDDFVGSGATLNETAKKLKDEGVKKVYGFAFVGNTNLSYEVINEI